MIPRIVHQTWRDRNLGPKFSRWSRSFRELFPGWEYRFWDDQDCLDLVRREFPRHEETYRGLANGAQRADLFRYMVVAVLGGLYADIDCECRRALDFIDDADEFIVAVELETASARVMELYQSDLGKIYCQWAFLAAPGHPILAGLIDDIARSAGRRLSENPILDGVKRTGPQAFTRSVNRHLERGGKVKVLPSSFLGCCDGRNRVRFALSFLFPELFRKVYIRHHFESTWMDPKVKREMLKRNLLLNPGKKRSGG